MKKQLRKKVVPINQYGRALTVKNCFDIVVEEGRLTLVLVPYQELGSVPPLLADYVEGAAADFQDTWPRKRIRRRDGVSGNPNRYPMQERAWHRATEAFHEPRCFHVLVGRNRPIHIRIPPPFTHL